MSHQQLQQQNREAAQKYGLNLAAIGKIVQVVQDHPEVVQLVQMAAALRGNPNLIGQFQQRADELIVGLVAGLDGVLEYAAQAESSARVAPSPMFAALHAAVDAWLLEFGPQAPAPAPAPAPTPPPAPTA